MKNEDTQMSDWIPLSVRKPAHTDADENGLVYYGAPNRIKKEFWGEPKRLEYTLGYTHWMPKSKEQSPEPLPMELDDV
jgi:hypothetical protein